MFKYTFQKVSEFGFGIYVKGTNYSCYWFVSQKSDEDIFAYFLANCNVTCLLRQESNQNKQGLYSYLGKMSF